MTDRNNFSVLDTNGIDTTDMFAAFAAGEGTLLSDNGSKALFSMDGSTMDFSLNYEMIGGTVHVNRVTLIDEPTDTVLGRGFYSAPQDLGIADWGTPVGPGSSGYYIITMTNLFEQIQWSYDGLRGDDVLQGADVGDQFQSAGGDDLAAGFGGADLFRLGTGDDYAHGGSGNDRLFGNGDDDMLRLGAGQDRAWGGSGNDVIEASEGQNQAWGGGGTDTFVFDAGVTGKTVLRDFASDDLILFAGFNSSASGSPNVATLDDLPSDWLNGFAFKEFGGAHLKLSAGDQTVILRNTLAEDVTIDQLYFGADSADDTLAAFGAGDATLGRSINGTDLDITGGPGATSFNYEEITWTVFSFPTSEFIAYGSETSL